MFHPRTFRTFARVIKILFMVLLIGFEYVPRSAGDDVSYINNAALQRVRSQMLINAAFILQYRPQAEHAQAIYNLQTVLPVFEREEALLKANTISDVQDILQQADSDYMSITTAAQAIMAHSQNINDPLEVTILILHENSYLVTMNALLLILPREFQDRNIQFFVIQIVIEIIVLCMFFLAMTTFIWEIERYKNGQTNKNESNPSRVQFIVHRLIIFILILVLMGLEIIPLGVGNETAYLNQAGLQRMRCEIVTTSAMELAYRPAGERPAVMSSIQIVLPLFQQEQTLLLTNENAMVHSYVLQATDEYQTMSTAAQILIKQPSQAVVLGLANTIMPHTSKCVKVMNNIVSVIQFQIEQQTNIAFLIEVGIEASLIIFFGILLLFSHDPFIPSKCKEKDELLMIQNALKVKKACDDRLT